MHHPKVCPRQLRTLCTASRFFLGREGGVAKMGQRGELPTNLSQLLTITSTSLAHYGHDLYYYSTFYVIQLIVHNVNQSMLRLQPWHPFKTSRATIQCPRFVVGPRIAREQVDVEEEE